MGLFDFFKKASNSKQPIPESEKKYYQPDSYYTTKDIRGEDVITFEERKKTSTVSRNGLYVAEILLLEYCSLGTYPHPKNGYPAFWWFEYGIRDVGTILHSLEERGFIRMSTPIESIPSLTSPQLKEILKAYNLPLSGKKDDLVQRIKENLSDNDVTGYISECKYTLTDLGKSELSENEYVPIMHKNKNHNLLWEINNKLPENKIIRDFLFDSIKKFPYIIEEILTFQEKIDLNQRSWQKRFYDILWGELNRKSMQCFSEQNYGLYRNVRLNMAMFSKEEQRYQDAVMFLSEVAFWDLNCCGNNFDYENFLVLNFEILKDGKSSFFPYEKSIMTIAPNVVKEIEICQKELNINDNELKDLLLESVKKFSAPIQIFTYEEIVDIFFWERDKNVIELNNVYGEAEKRFDLLNQKRTIKNK